MKRFYRLILSMLFSGFVIQGFSQQQQVSFSIQAHQDDWSLFWTQSIMNDINSGGKVVFVTLTAGDAGNGSGGFCAPVFSYYAGREKGAMYSTKYAVDLNASVPGIKPDSTRTTINGHSMVKYTYGNTINYFLRLPDGAISGDGYPITLNRTLKKLKKGEVPSLSSVDGTATYTGWSDLVTTIRTIINTERGLDNQPILHTASLDTLGANSGDHSDHIYTSIAAQEAVSDLLWLGINEYIDYRSPNFPPNLTVTEHARATAIFTVNSWGLLEGKYLSSFEPGHKLWLPVDVLIVKRVPTGNAPGTTNFTSGGTQASGKSAPSGSNTLPKGVIMYSDYQKLPRL